MNNETEILTIDTGKELKRNEKYNLYFDYTSINNDDMSGFYRSSYKTNKGGRRYANHTAPKINVMNNFKSSIFSKNKKLLFRWLLTTQFQPNSARKAFPCFDEPKYKATFEMAISLSKKAANDGYAALFNTDLVKRTEYVILFSSHCVHLDETSL